MNRPIRLCLIKNVPTPHQCETNAAIASRSDIDIHVLYTQPAKAPTQAFSHEFVPAHRVSESLYLNRGLIAAMRRYKPDIMMTGQYSSPGSMTAMLYASATRLPWVFHAEEPHVRWHSAPVIRSERLRRVARFLATLPIRRWPREVWAIGGQAERAYQALTRVPVVNMPYFSDLSRYLAISRTRPDGPLAVLYFGRLIERKGVDVLLQALEKLLPLVPDFTVTFAGKGPLSQSVEALADAWPNRVSYVGFVPPESVQALLAEHDVFVCPSRHDGWGMVIPEAMGAGLAVVATDAMGASRDLIRDQKNGLIIAPDSVDSIVQALRSLLEDPARIAALRDAARQDVRVVDSRAGAQRWASRLNAIVSASRGGQA
ncbi:MAG: glycosyltransferase involved in cell wall biosynthesis [Myxococcota bacterium]|jgi:glycosyltransferase involved in cell wall biosynthesis